MIKARLEAKPFRIFLVCMSLFLSAIIICAPILRLVNDEMLYSVFPFLNFGLSVSGSIFGWEIPAVVSNNFSFAVSIASIVAALWIFVHIIYVIYLNILRGQRSKAAKVLRKTGYSAEYFEILERKHAKLSRSSFSEENMLCLAKQYCDGRRYESAFELLKNADIEGFSVNDAVRYYALYAYVFILMGDLKNVEFALELAEPFVEKCRDRTEFDFVKALYLYAKHDFDGAKNGFKPLCSCKNREIKVWAGMYLALIYLRLHNKEKARKLAVTLSGYKKTPRQSEDMLKLLKKIETAYMLESKEQGEKARNEFAPAAKSAQAAQTAQDQTSDAAAKTPVV